MKKLFILIFISLSLCIHGKTYYVSNTGNNANPGTKNEPFATWDYLAAVLTPGDTGFIRGGTYFSNKPASEKFRNNFSDLSGLPGNLIYIWAYPGEIPVFDGSNIPLQNTPILMYINKCNYCHFKGLRVTNAPQPVDTSPVIGWFVFESSYNIIENCIADHIGGFGFCIGAIQWIPAVLHSTDNLILNCDAYDIADPLSSSPYDGSNGFSIDHNDKAERTTFRGCRAWYCSDDGFEVFNSDCYPINFENCWSFWNGYVNGAPAPGIAIGVGFKLGKILNLPLDVTMGKVTNCIAAQNTATGFSSNGRSPIWELNNNIAYDNEEHGFFFTWGYEVSDILRNNISYSNGPDNNYWNQIGTYTSFNVWVQSNNTWNFTGGPCPPFINIDVSDADFVSLDATQLVRPRKPDGSLPDIDFLHLVPESDLLNTGAEVGLPYVGSAPDIGAFEVITGADAAIPEYMNSVIRDPSPQVIELNLNLTLDNNKIPLASDFLVRVNSNIRNVILVEIVGSVVKLTLSDPVESGDIVLVSYNKPPINPLRTIYGGEVVDLINKKVTNWVGILNSNQLLMATIYPNPAQTYFNIRIDGDPPAQNLSVRLFNCTGKLVQEDNLKVGSLTSLIHIDLNPGIYLIQINSGILTFFSQKIVVSK